jgi:hypothetical protein
VAGSGVCTACRVVRLVLAAGLTGSAGALVGLHLGEGLDVPVWLYAALCAGVAACALAVLGLPRASLAGRVPGQGTGRGNEAG